MQLVYNPGNVQTGPHKKSLALLEPQGTGRFTFVVLSSFTGSHGALSVAKQRKNFAWVDLIPQVLETIEMGVVQPKFSHSKTLMMLRDSLLRRQITSLILQVTEDENMRDTIVMWLELAEHLGLKGRANIMNYEHDYNNEVINSSIKKSVGDKGVYDEMMKARRDLIVGHEAQECVKSSVDESDEHHKIFGPASLRSTIVSPAQFPSFANSFRDDMALENELKYENGREMNL